MDLINQFNGLNLNPHYTFDTFLVHPSNQFAYYAAKAVADRPGVAYNPLIIYGKEGLGKTHLMHAIGSAILDKHSTWKVFLLAAECLGENIVTATTYSKLNEWEDIFKTMDVLLIDDIQSLDWKPFTQDKVFHILNSLYEKQKQIVLTSNKWPGEMPHIRHTLITRFKRNLVADIQPPEIRIRFQ